MSQHLTLGHDSQFSCSQASLSSILFGRSQLTDPQKSPKNVAYIVNQMGGLRLVQGGEIFNLTKCMPDIEAATWVSVCYLTLVNPGQEFFC